MDLKKTSFVCRDTRYGWGEYHLPSPLSQVTTKTHHKLQPGPSGYNVSKANIYKSCNNLVDPKDVLDQKHNELPNVFPNVWRVDNL